MNFTLRVWRQQNATAPGKFVTYQVKEVTPDMSFLEMLDALNEDLLSQGEPQAFPVIRDLMVNRSAFDRIIQAGGFISAPTGSAPAANSILVPKEAADTAFDAAACIGCGACVAACPNSAAMLFTSAKIRHLNSLPQGQPQRDQRTLGMVVAMMNEHFGSCTNHGECEAVCPKEIPLEFIGKMNRDLIQAIFGRRREPLNIPSVVQQPSQEDAVIEAAKS